MYQTETLFNGQIDNVKMVKYRTTWPLQCSDIVCIVWKTHLILLDYPSKSEKPLFLQTVHSDSASMKTFPTPSKAAGMCIPVHRILITDMIPVQNLCESVVFGVVSQSVNSKERKKHHYIIMY